MKEKKYWKSLKAHFDRIKALHLRDLFEEDPKRGTELTAEGAGTSAMSE